MSVVSSLKLEGRVVQQTSRHDGGYLVRVQTCEGLKVARSLRAYPEGAAVILRGPPPDFSIVE